MAMRSRPQLACFSLGILALVLLFAARVTAQEANEAPKNQVALNRFEPSFAGDRMFGVPSAFTPGNPGLHVALFGDYAHDPLVLRTEDGDEQVGGVVSRQFFLHLNATLALFDRLSLNVNAPLAVYQKGGDPEASGTAYESPDEVQFGDLRFGARLRLVGEYFDAFQLALGGYVWVPTSPSDSFVGEKSVRGMPQLLFGGLVADTLVWSLNGGVEFRPETELASTPQGSMVRYGAGLGVLLGDAKRFQLSGEYTGAFVYEEVDERSLNSELLFGARYRIVEDFEIGAGAGPGLSSGIGTPDFRAVFMLAYTPMQHQEVAAHRDRDGDGILDSVDACPEQPGQASEDPKKHGCPADRDGDGVLDEVDACPDEPGAPNEDPAQNGCPPPPDRDGDGVIDADDHCPEVKGVRSDDPEMNGCPPDRDGDGIIDEQDACPDLKGVASDVPEQNGCPPDTDKDSFRDDQDGCPFEKGPDNPDPAKRGCPTMVRVTEKEIVILQQVLFDTGRATIKKESFPLIDEVVGALKDHPEIAELRVEGHTDSRGAKAFNMKLSQNRADSVMKALIERGIEPARLSAQGFGPTVPIGDNATEEGRQQNRRVQFIVVAKKDLMGVPAKPGPGAEGLAP